MNEVALSNTDEAVRVLAIYIRQPSDVRRHGPLIPVFVGESERFERAAARCELDTASASLAGSTSISVSVPSIEVRSSQRSSKSPVGSLNVDSTTDVNVPSSLVSTPARAFVMRFPNSLLKYSRKSDCFAPLGMFNARFIELPLGRYEDAIVATSIAFL
ncbi:hypothetical protein [Burkholderia multivorans]|uniref:hypothetical protein n=1 Tax=Burkholderia multivorans TaxID=87883 RepID=UPI000F5085A7|nr:hypothetical protein [Burkholderia multivorans]